MLSQRLGLHLSHMDMKFPKVFLIRTYFYLITSPSPPPSSLILRLFYFSLSNHCLKSPCVAMNYPTLLDNK